MDETKVKRRQRIAVEWRKMAGKLPKGSSERIVLESKARRMIALAKHARKEDSPQR